MIYLIIALSIPVVIGALYFLLFSNPDLTREQRDYITTKRYSNYQSINQAELERKFMENNED